MKMKFLKEQGFTLVELMVVVAIIGILSAVAIPNFKKYQAKSKTSEAKLQLASIYSAETAMQGDYDSFATCLPDAGYVGPTQGNYYAVGFSVNNAVTGPNVVANGGVCATTGFGFPAFKKVGNVTATVANIAVVGTISKTIASKHVAAGGVQSTVGVTNIGDEFVAGAIGYVSADFVSSINVADMWWIDENKVLQQDNDGY
ncbi:MAG: type II secretion system protein [Halobacteriovoraceae bacterium]|jgi:type IV pilus assembly protein PilA|nr:type II secretion system protein [Halobacteriovoraceae bacterium]MBT5093501.1 type II secretion system protein [Halobacteriovoraceae bacterium]